MVKEGFLLAHFIAKLSLSCCNPLKSSFNLIKEFYVEKITDEKKEYLNIETAYGADK